MAYRTTVYFPDEFKELIEARPEINISEVCRAAVAEVLGFKDVNSITKRIEAHKKTLVVLEKQLAEFNKTIFEPENKMLLFLFKAESKTGKRELLVSTFGNASVISLVQKSLLIPHPSLNGYMMLTAKGKERAEKLGGKV